MWWRRNLADREGIPPPGGPGAVASVNEKLRLCRDLFMIYAFAMKSQAFLDSQPEAQRLGGYFSKEYARMNPHALARAGLLLVCLLSVFLEPGPAAANAKHTVFGFVLGAPLPESLRSGLRPGDDGFLRYQGDCPDADLPFTLLRVRVSPKTHTVVNVSAAALYHDCVKGEAALWQLRDRLKERYGKIAKQKQSDGERFEIKRGQLRIVFYLRSAMFEDHCVLYANFMDLAAYKKYGKEAEAALEQ